MESYQRENERKEKKNQKMKKRKLAVWVVILLVIAALVIMKISEIDFRGFFDSVKNPSGITIRPTP